VVDGRREVAGGRWEVGDWEKANPLSRNPQTVDSMWEVAGGRWGRD